MTGIRIVTGIVLLGAATSASAGYELVCKGSSAGGGNTPVIVDCADRRQVVQALHDAWQAVRGQHVGGARDEPCGGAYRQANELPPATDVRTLAPGYFAHCNSALSYIRRGL